MNEQDFDKSPEGIETVALLERHAPPVPDTNASIEAVMARINHAEKPAGILYQLRWITPIVGAAAAAIVIMLVVTGPERSTNTPDNPPPVADVETPDAPRTVIMREQTWPDITAQVRGTAVDGWRIDAGLVDGLRVGDILTGSGGAKIRVASVGVFDARVASEAKLRRGDQLVAPVTTEAQKRAAKFREFGGDPGAFFQFGAVVSALPIEEARRLGISDGRALRVDETIDRLMADPDQPVKPTLASRLGLAKGDVIVEVNGTAIRTPADLSSAMGWSLQPDLLFMQVIRNGKQVDLQLK